MVIVSTVPVNAGAAVTGGAGVVGGASVVVVVEAARAVVVVARAVVVVDGVDLVDVERGAVLSVPEDPHAALVSSVMAANADATR